MTETKKTTTPDTSVGADAVQPLLKNSTNSITDSSNNCNLHTISMTELYDTVYPPRRPIVDNLLYSGTYLFVGAPKIGKSFFMAQLAYTVATGLILWEYEVHQGTVLYLALEDNYARLQRRLSRMFGVEETDNLYFATQAKSVVGGLDEQLEEFVKAHPTVRLIIIDTLQKVREVSGECYSYASDYEIVTRLKKFSDSHGICLLVVHHTRKMEAGDSFDMISGTNGLLGAADGAFIMQKKRRTDNIATLDVVGRDQSDQELTLEFDRERCVWNFQGAETQLWKQPPDPVLEAVSKIFLSAGSAWCGTPTELLTLLPDVEMQAKVEEAIDELANYKDAYYYKFYIERCEELANNNQIQSIVFAYKDFGTSAIGTLYTYSDSWSYWEMIDFKAGSITKMNDDQVTQALESFMINNHISNMDNLDQIFDDDREIYKARM